MSSLWKRVAVRQATVAHLRSRGTFRSDCNFRPSLLVVQTHSTYSKRTGKIQCKSPKVKGLAVQVHVFSQAQALWLSGKSIFSNTRHNSSKLNLTKICLMRQRFFFDNRLIETIKKVEYFWHDIIHSKIHVVCFSPCEIRKPTDAYLQDRDPLPWDHQCFRNWVCQSFWFRWFKVLR